MAAKNAQQIDIDGLKPTYSAASAGGDTVPQGDRVFVHVKNGDSGSHTVTVVVPGKEYTQDRPDVPVAIPAGEDRMIGPLSPALDFADPSDGRVHLTYDAVTSVTLAVLQL